MKKKVLQIGSYVLVAVLATVITLFYTGGGNTKLAELEGLIDSCFVEDVDREDLRDAAADAMVKATGDQWSYYMSASEYEAYQEQVNNSYVGIGITILQEGEEGFRIIDVAEGGPAQEAGLQVNDLLVEVEGTNVRDLAVTDVRALVKGEEGTSVALRVLRLGEQRSYIVERRRVQTPVAKYELLEDNVGLVTIVNFDTRCAEETIAGIEALLEQGAEKLIFDVRYNPGGYATELVEVLDYLLPEGDLFRTVRYDGKENVDVSDENHLDIPMAVLVNGGSYSAAEFFAAALSEYEAAVVVGEPTVGKGYFQTTYPLSDGSAVSLSIGKYYTPKGVNLSEAGGLTPDILVELTEEQNQNLYYSILSRQEDPQLQAAIKALK